LETHLFFRLAKAFIGTSIGNTPGRFTHHSSGWIVRAY
jgi:hypothetical protein